MMLVYFSICLVVVVLMARLIIRLLDGSSGFDPDNNSDGGGGSGRPDLPIVEPPRKNARLEDWQTDRIETSVITPLKAKV